MEIIVWFAIAVIAIILLYWLLQQLPLPEPAGKFITIAIVVVVALVVIGFLMQFAGGSLPRLR